MTFTRNQAKMIAEELYKIIHKDLVTAAKEIVVEDTDEYINSVDAAKILNWSVGTLYNRKNDVGAFVKVGNRLMFSKRALRQRISSGAL